MAATLFFGEFLQKTDLVVTTKCVFFPKGDLDYSLLSKYKAFGCVPSSVLDPLHQKQPAITSVTYWETASHGQVGYHFAQFNNELSRNMGHLRVDNLQSTLTKALPSTGDVFIAVMIEGKHHALCTGLAVSRLFPLYNRKTGAKAPESRNVYVDFILQMDEDIDYQEIQHLCDSMRM
ncbi:hypothetical protein HMI54_005279, partial [Coelomomyces lativittatus]